MPQEITATDKNGNKVRWDGTKWVPYIPEETPGTKAIQQTTSTAPQKKEVVKPPWYDNYLGLIRPMLAGAQSGMAGTVKGLVKAADFISDKLNIPKSDAARMIARDLDTYAEANRRRGVGGIAGQAAEGLGGAAVAIPEIGILGPYGMAVQGGLQGAAEGGVPGAITGAVGGGLSQGILKGVSGMTLPGRVASSAAFGAATTPGGVKERVAGAATMGALGAMGEGPQKGVVDLRPGVKVITKGRVKAEPLPEPVQKLVDAVNTAKPIRKEQETLYKKERGERINKAVAVGKETSGEAGFYAEKSQLAGELPKISYEPIRGQIGQADIDALFNMVKDSPKITDWEKIRAREGLAKIFSEKGVTVPQENELALLNDVFGRRLTDTLLRKRGAWEQVKKGVLEVANIPRALMSSFDFSAPFRQGVFLINHPKQFFGSFMRMFKAFPSDKAYQAIMDDIYAKPTYKLMREHGLQITDIDAMPTKTEERFMSNWAEKIPMAGRVVRGSNRAYTGFLNKLRADVFDDLVKKADKLGLFKNEAGISDFRNNGQLLDSLSKFVNAATGRGNLGKYTSWGPALNAFFFSPRLMASRISLMNPRFYYKLDPFVRKEALKSLIAFTGAGVTTLTLLKMAGLDVGTNPTSADFGKIKVGPTRIDIWGGFQQYARTAAQLIAGKTTSSTSGRETKVGVGYKPLTRFDILTRALEYKEAPIASFATALLKGGSAFGGELNIPQEIYNRFTPMVVQDALDLYREDPGFLPLSALGVFGFGLQTYTNQKQKTSVR